jgi:HAE1 family hydrophobic/amphiphilic exporter-1
MVTSSRQGYKIEAQANTTFPWRRSGNLISLVLAILLLMGLAAKNGILLVDYTNFQRRRGLGRTAALLKAGPMKPRLILTTTFAMVFGMTPVAFVFGGGSELRAPMGQAIIGGLIMSTVLTLFIVPVVCTILDDLSLQKVFAFVRTVNILRIV